MEGAAVMENLVSQGLPLALFGVGVVFVFFCLLIAATSAMSWLAAGFGQAPGQASGQRGNTVMPPAQMAAVIAAIAMHRARRLASGNPS